MKCRCCGKEYDSILTLCEECERMVNEYDRENNDSSE